MTRNLLNVSTSSAGRVLGATAILAFGFVHTPSAKAAIFIETFDDANEALLGAAPLLGDGSAYNRTERFTVQTAETSFGSQYGDFNDNAGSDDSGWDGINGIGAADEALTTISFRFFEPTTTNQDGGIILILGPTGNPVQARAVINFTEGTLTAQSAAGNQTASYALDAIHTVQIVVNDTTGSLAYDSISDTIDAKRYDVWLDGLLVAEDLAFVNDTQNFDSFAWDTFNGDRQRLFVDDFVVESGATVIPEPAALALVALGSLLLIGRPREA